MEASEVERLWVLTDPDFQMLSLRLLRTRERVRMCCHKRFVFLGSYGEEHTDVTNGRREEARRACTRMLSR